MSKMNSYVVFLRAINVAGKNVIKMADLKSVLEQNGFEKVETYIQSGNILLQTHFDISETEHAIEQLLKDKFQLEIKVFVYTTQAIIQFLEQNPFDHSIPGNLVYFTFLEKIPAQENLEKLLLVAAAEEKICLKESLLYCYFPDGMGKTKLTNTAVESKLKLLSTARNRNTMEKIKQLIEG